jgi:hypothetical protein
VGEVRQEYHSLLNYDARLYGNFMTFQALLKKHNLWVWILGAVAITILVQKYSTKTPCTVTPIPSYFYSLDSYRTHRIQDEIESVNGDRFDEEAARKRILSIPDDTLESERQTELVFMTKAYNEAREHCR